jgi:hypothetical protein
MSGFGPSELQWSRGASETNHLSGEDLARGAALGTAGLSKPDFFNYLWWLLNGRAVDVDEFKIAPGSRLGFSLFGTSDATGKVISKTFRTYDDLEVWAEDALKQLVTFRG